jgi:hypothetical protein
MPMVCSIYEKRPQMCRDYPKRDSYIPESCTFYFTLEGRQGQCDPQCDGACCRLPREGGEPCAFGLPEISGGMPCKFLEHRDKHPNEEQHERK